MKMDEKEKAIKAGENLLDGMRFDNLDEQREIVNVMKRYRKSKVKGKDLTLEERLILVELRARAIEPTSLRLRSVGKELRMIYVILMLALGTIIFILWTK